MLCTIKCVNCECVKYMICVPIWEGFKMFTSLLFIIPQNGFPRLLPLVIWVEVVAVFIYCSEIISE